MADQEKLDLESILGKTLLGSASKLQPLSELEGKNVMIYFSAHWYVISASQTVSCSAEGWHRYEQVSS